MNDCQLDSRLHYDIKQTKTFLWENETSYHLNL